MPSAPYQGWVWPVPAFRDGRPPVVSDGFGRDKRGGRGHLGVDVMYKRPRRGEPALPAQTALFELPSRTVPALAAGPGTVFRVNRDDPNGISVTIDHHQVDGAGPRVTVYRHLASVDVREGQLVEAGARLGLVGDNPGQVGDPNHLHFELWDTARPGSGSGRERFAVDPEPAMGRWRVLPWPDELGVLLVVAGLALAAAAGGIV